MITLLGYFIFWICITALVIKIFNELSESHRPVPCSDEPTERWFSYDILSYKRLDFDTVELEISPENYSQYPLVTDSKSTLIFAGPSPIAGCYQRNMVECHILSLDSCKAKVKFPLNESFFDDCQILSINQLQK